ncbi:MAG: molybdopterin-dependent oxidoreductase [Vicinamibacterales bacterium]
MHDVSHPPRGRRRFLARTLAAGAAAAVPDAWLARLWAQAGCDDAPLGELVGVLPLYGVGSEPVPLGESLGGRGLATRLFTDLSALAPGTLVTPTEQVFVRTAAPAGLNHDGAAWRIRLRAAAEAPAIELTAAALDAEARPMGAHVMECAGNSNPQNFGLMSAVEWHGVPLTAVLARVPRPPAATAVLVSGVDHEVQDTPQSLPGASWVLDTDALGRTGAFLATRMNGRPLTADHGAPVRLVVPGWYGCAWIKWVDEVRWAGGAEPSTTQMLEFAFRTHQDGIPELARDYAEPAIDTAAMPVRIEQRRVGGRTEYRIVGIVWGGSRPVDRLLLRIGSRTSEVPVTLCPAPRTVQTWALWTHRWRPTEPGYYDLALRAADPAIRTRRLDLSFYIRRVRIDEV